MADADAADRPPEDRCFICETDESEAEAGLEAYICPICLFQAVKPLQPFKSDLNDAE